MSSCVRGTTCMVGMLFVLAADVLPSGDFAIPADLAVYGDSLAAGWENWSWSTIANFGNTSPVHGGTRSLAATYTGAWAGLYLALDTPVSVDSYDTLQFWLHGGTQGSQKVRVVLADGSHTLLADRAVTVPVGAGVWTQVKVLLADLGNPAQIGGIVWQDTSGGAQPTFYLDDISIVSQGIIPPPPPPPGAGPALSVNAGAGRHAIREGIYGMNFADEPLAADLRLPVRRWGGNSTTRYNWQTSMINVGSDWYFENLPEGSVNVASLPNGSASDQFVEQDRRTGTKSLITVPLVGWTPKGTNPRAHPYDCAFKVSKYGPQQSTDYWDPDCGNGVRTNNTPILGTDPTDTSMQIGPDFVTAWINHLAGKYGTAANGGVAYYNLDNEPMLWNSTHRDVHPQPTTYDELRDRTYQYGAAIKSADSSAKTLGPVLWGWCAYLYSAQDGCEIGADYLTHGSTPFVAWYLQQMQAYEQQHGTRILDYLDLHYYPAAQGVSLSPAGSAATQALRLRATRSLWDPSYVDESWISDTEPGGVAVRVIPRMRDWVSANYPGTKLSITEYNWGALDHINGALAQADVLGIFGREGLDLATLWGPPSATQPGAFAFRMYRNYDGEGHGFGDVSVQATSEDQDTLAVYAGQRSVDNALTVIVINKTANSLTSNINLAGFTPTSTATVFRYGADDLSAIEHLADQPVNGGGFSATFAANSITLLVMMPGSTPPASKTRIGIYRQATGYWYLDLNGNGAFEGCATDACYAFGGDPSDVSVVGDWNGDKTSKIGIFRPSSGTWYLDTNGDGRFDNCLVDKCIPWGGMGDIPVVGDWDGDGKTKVGIFRPSNGTWYLDTNGDGRFDNCVVDKCIPWGGSTDIPVVGDWTGDGKTKIGIFRPSNGTWYLDTDGNGIFDNCVLDKCFPWGGSTDIPVVGDWGGDGKTKIGIFRPATGYWYLDVDGNGRLDCSLDTCVQWGGSTDVPLVGKW